MRHNGFSFVLVLFVVLFAVDDSLANVVEQYILKDGREQCEEIKPYCPPEKPGTKPRKRKPPPPKAKVKKKCKRQYRIRPSNRCPYVRRPACKKPVVTKKISDQNVKNAKLQSKALDPRLNNTKLQGKKVDQNKNYDLQRGSKEAAKLQGKTVDQNENFDLQRGSREAAVLLKEVTTKTDSQQSREAAMALKSATIKTDFQRPPPLPKDYTKSDIRPPASCEGCEKKLLTKLECSEELLQSRKPPGALKKSTPCLPKLERNEMGLNSKTCNECPKKIIFKEDLISCKSKCIKCPKPIAKAGDRLASHFRQPETKTGLMGLSKRQIGSDRDVLEVRVPTMTDIARMGWNFVTFTTDQCFNLVSRIQEARERRRLKI